MRDDEDAQRFDLLILKIQLAKLDTDVLAADRLRQQAQQITSALLGQTSIPAVAEQQALLAEVTEDEWWVDVTLPMLELARRRPVALSRRSPGATGDPRPLPHPG